MTYSDGANYIDVNVINAMAFLNSNITSVIIPHNIQKVGEAAFKGCSALKEIAVADEFESDSNPFVSCKIEKATLPLSMVKYVNKRSAENTELKEIVILGGTVIDEYLFEDCTKLEKVVLSNTITKIGQYAFYNTDSLVEINFPDSLVLI